MDSMQDQNSVDLPPIQSLPGQQVDMPDPQFVQPLANNPFPDPAPMTSQTIVPLPQDAADDDLIEKEWVLKAKQIVAHTSDDPYNQQVQLSKVKADYMKKRYNKDIKIIEEQ